MSGTEADVLLAAWWSIFRNQRLTVQQVIITAIEGGEETANLRSILDQIAPSVYPGTYSPHKLGRWLARHANIGSHLGIVTGPQYLLVQRDKIRHQSVWQLVPSDLPIPIPIPIPQKEETGAHASAAA